MASTAHIATINGIPVFEAVLGDADCGMKRISLVDDPAVCSNFVALASKAVPIALKVVDEEKQLVRGVVLRADFPIYRVDEQSGEYYIIYKADTIREMAEKYLTESRQNNIDLDHDGVEVGGVQMVQWFIKDSSAGISPEGFEDISDGSLFAEFHITDPDIWEEVKAGTYKGFSLEGLFDLVPEQNESRTDAIARALAGKFCKLFKIDNMGKMNRVKELLAKMFAEFASVTTDKGILAWDGDEDLKAGDNVYIEDSEGNRSEAADGDYTTEDGKVIRVADGKVSEIVDRAAEVDSQEEDFERVATDKGDLEWDGDDDLKAGDAVFVQDEDGNRVAAPDGDYTTEDGKIIRVVEGKVAEILDPSAEVAEEVEARRQTALAKIQKMEASFDEKYRAIHEAAAARYGENCYMKEAGDDFAIICVFDANWNEKYYRHSVSWAEDGKAELGEEAVEVKPMWVPMDFKSPFEEDDEAAAAEEAREEEMSALRKENADLKAQVEKLSKVPAAVTLHEQVTTLGTTPAGLPKGTARIAHLMSLGRE